MRAGLEGQATTRVSYPCIRSNTSATRRCASAGSGRMGLGGWAVVSASWELRMLQRPDKFSLLCQPVGHVNACDSPTRKSGSFVSQRTFRTR